MSGDDRIGVCFPRGFRAAGVTCGIKDSGAPDLALLACDGDAAAAGAFTRSRLAAAPVLVSREHLADGRARAVVINSGNANACTGAQGLDDARAMASETARALGLAPADVLVCSTGVIGKPLPMDAVAEGIARAAEELSEGGGADAADAIRTTDAWAKTSTATVMLSGGDVRIGVMGKGAGMIRPNVATTIVTATTDAVVQPSVLAGLLREAADASLNLVSVDGSESTNDALVVLASGASGVTAGGADAEALGRALTRALLDVARQMVADGEGSSRFAHYTVTGAADDSEARTAVRAIGEDILVRCALHGSDPNWGRMLARAGTCGVVLDPDRIAVWVGPAQLVAGGVEVTGARREAQAALSEPEVEIRIDLASGNGRAELYASSLSPAYVTFNAEYTT
ncbi:MAG TPA: bifunctional glutamate N-acetyltransferase/amino-acid acetyltransferase ArgJ [Gaiellales bacterium]|jgi:glutamate N-acetyltransferase/amino-acid N-acetyltransferase|nr:bifunctional glutamate N-acetyltransferase/amino-acid acetyltransferase ArgJ [Gaiellales bacterium]